MTLGRRRLLLTVWALLTLGLAVRALGRGLLGTRAIPVATVTPIVVDLDRAGVDELMALPGIGAVRAEAIVLDRIRHGPFRSPSALERVDGLGPEVVEGLRSFVMCSRER